ncbi:MAG: universal stress protein [Polyangia bacterium]
MFRLQSQSLQLRRRPSRTLPARSVYPAATERVIVVGVGFGPPSRRALRRADELARALGCRLRLVHAAAESSVEPTVPAFVRQQLAELPDSAERMQTTVQAWAAFLAGVMVPTSQICTEPGDPLSVLQKEAARPDVAMVVLGRGERPGGCARSSLAHQLLRICPRPVLVVGERGLSPVIMAATDCTDDKLPVLWEASALVPALGDKVVAVHNLDAEACRRAASLGQPLTPQLAGMLCTGVQEWLDASQEAHELLITNQDSTAEGVLAAARSQQADLLVVGARSEHEAEKRTAEILLDECPVSVLLVPLGREPEARCSPVMAAAPQPLEPAAQEPLP